MKTFFTLLASLIVSVAVFAAEARPKSALIIQSADNADLRIVVDGRRFEPKHNAITIRSLDAGAHYVKIYKEKNFGFYMIFGKKYDVVFSGTVIMKPRTNTMISVDRFNRTTVINSRKTGRTGNVKRWDDDDFDFDRGGRYGDYDERDGRWNDRDSRYEMERGMNDREFRSVLESIQREWLESNKLKSATHIVTTNRLTSAQVKQMLILFSFEANKLQLAKSAYANTADKRNYEMVYDVFSFNSSKVELARYIRNFR